MGLTDLLAATAVRRLHVLIVEGDEAFALRVAAERACQSRGWTLASSPADADLLLVCRPPTGPFIDAVDATYIQLPGPRARANVWNEHDLEIVFDQLQHDYLRRRAVGDVAAQGPGPAEHSDVSSAHDDPQDAPETQPGQHGEHGASSGRDHPEDGGHDVHAGHETHAGEDMPAGPAGHEMHAGHESHDGHAGHDMDMSGPGGVALASGAEDRDGLEMDRLHLRLGPVLPSWPAGLAVWCTLAGDVVTDAEVEQPPLRPVPPQAHATVLVAARLDAAAQLLSLAGAGVLAGRARTARDLALAGAGPDTTVAELVEELHRRVRRSRVLRWSLRGLGSVSAAGGREHGWPASWVGDVHARLLRLLAAGPEATGLVAGAEVAASLPVLLPGLDLAAARLVVASLVGQAADPVVAPRQAAVG